MTSYVRTLYPENRQRVYQRQPARVAAGYDELDARLTELQREIGAARLPADAPPLAVTGLRSGVLGEQLREITEATAGLSGRAHTVESKLRTHESAIKDARSKIGMLHRKGTDPWTGGQDAWNTGRQ